MITSAMIHIAKEDERTCAADLARNALCRSPGFQKDEASSDEACKDNGHEQDQVDGTFAADLMDQGRDRAGGDQGDPGRSEDGLLWHLSGNLRAVAGNKGGDERPNAAPEATQDGDRGFDHGGVDKNHLYVVAVRVVSVVVIDEPGSDVGGSVDVSWTTDVSDDVVYLSKEIVATRHERTE